jgi:hypothetical protein
MFRRLETYQWKNFEKSSMQVKAKFIKRKERLTTKNSNCLSTWRNTISKFKRQTRKLSRGDCNIHVKLRANPISIEKFLQPNEEKNIKRPQRNFSKRAYIHNELLLFTHKKESNSAICVSVDAGPEK